MISGRPQAFSQEICQQILTLRQGGMSVVDVGKQLQLDKRTVVFLTPPEFLEQERQKIQLRKDAVCASAAQGLTQTQIAQTLHEDKATVHRWLKEVGLIPKSVRRGGWRGGPTHSDNSAKRHGFENLEARCLAWAKDRGGTCREITRVTVDAIWRCKEGHEWSATPANILNCKTWCPKCFGREYSNRAAQQSGFENLEARCVAWAKSKGGGCRDIVATKVDATWMCKEGHEWSATPNNIVSHQSWCPRCAKHGPGKGQLEIYEYIKNLLPGVEVLLNDKKTIINPNTDYYLELDIYIPSKNFAIEYDGLIHHSSKFQPDQTRHLTKALECRKQNIRLLAIFEDEWHTKPDLIRAMIRHRLGLFGTKLRASKLRLERLNKNSQFKEFFRRNHLDGHTNAKHAYGLFDGDKLVSCMSIRKNHQSEIEIARFATDYDYHVHGGGGRLIKAALAEHGSIVTFSNNRLSSGDVYQKVGAELLSECGSSYYYTDGTTRFWRYKCRRLNDPEILAKYPEVPHTERDQALGGVFSMEALGLGDRRPLYKITDYGHRKWILRLTPSASASIDVEHQTNGGNNGSQ